MMDKEATEFFRKKLRISLLGEPLLMSQSQVIELCKKFFQYGLDYNKK